MLTYLKRANYECAAISFFYGQKHNFELIKASMAAQKLQIPHRIARIPVELFKNSALTGGVSVPLRRNLDLVPGGEPAPTYVPARNTVFLALAAALADGLNYNYIAYAAHKEDHMGYPDCRPEYFAAMSDALKLGTKNQIDVIAPFIYMYKHEIVAKAASVGAPVELTLSCYQGLEPACGVCDTCQIRIQAFKKAGYIDPIPYDIEIDWGKSKPWPGL
jgi:7-cyano-7-deazaguanine synthase